MYLGIDIGGTKTLVAVFTNEGKISEKVKFPTAKNYDHFLLELRNALAHFKHQDFQACGVGMPVTVFDRKHGRGISYGNLPWKNVPIEHDIHQIVKCPVAIENDAKLGAVSETHFINDKFSKVLYVTVSTGIGFGLVVDGQLDTGIGDAGGKAMMLEHKGKRVSWEKFASGHAIVERYGKFAEDITDTQTWRYICRDLAKGFVELVAVIQPEVIVIGGSVGNYFERYGDILKEEMTKYELPLIKMPKLMKAQNPTEAVIYGCYYYAYQKFGVREKVNT